MLSKGVFFAVVLVAFCAAGSAAAQWHPPTSTPTRPPTATYPPPPATPTRTPTPRPTMSLTPTPTRTPTPSSSVTATPTPSSSVTATPTSVAPSATPTPKSRQMPNNCRVDYEIWRVVIHCAASVPEPCTDWALTVCVMPGATFRYELVERALTPTPVR
jgi:hypothetical protein